MNEGITFHDREISTLVSGDLSLEYFNKTSEHEPIGKFVIGDLNYLYALKLTSYGEPLQYTIEHTDTIRAYTKNGNIFTIQIETNGHYQYILLDSLDSYTNQPIYIDFSSVIQFIDATGDATVLMDGALQVTVINDIPHEMSKETHLNLELIEQENYQFCLEDLLEDNATYTISDFNADGDTISFINENGELVKVDDLQQKIVKVAKDTESGDVLLELGSGASIILAAPVGLADSVDSLNDLSSIVINIADAS